MAHSKEQPRHNINIVLAATYLLLRMMIQATEAKSEQPKNPEATSYKRNIAVACCLLITLYKLLSLCYRYHENRERRIFAARCRHGTLKYSLTLQRNPVQEQRELMNQRSTRLRF